MPKSPFYPLVDVHRLARTPRYVRIRTTKASDVVMLRLELSLVEARRFIIEHILSLSEGDFWKTLPPDDMNPTHADEYGIYARGVAWYVKVKIEDGALLIAVSFHPPTGPLRVASGTVIHR